MKKVIFTMIVSCLVSVVTVNAQLLSNNRTNKESKKRQAVLSKKSISDPHWKFSDYDPKKSKKEQRELNKQTRELAAQSYTPAKSPYYNKKQAREQKAKEIRMKRLNDGKKTAKDKRVKRVSKDRDKKMSKVKRSQTRDVKSNKKHYGSKASRKQFKTTARLTLKDMK